MYSNVYDVCLWRTSRFCFFYASSSSSSSTLSSLLLSSDVSHKHKPAFFCRFCCRSVGPEVFAFSPGVLCVKFVLLWVSFCFVHLLHRTCRTILRDAKTWARSSKKTKTTAMERTHRNTQVAFIIFIQKQQQKSTEEPKLSIIWTIVGSQAKYSIMLRSFEKVNDVTSVSLLKRFKMIVSFKHQCAKLSRNSSFLRA